VSEVRPVTVVVPTVGRPELVSACLDSLARCEPRPAEILVIDQSGADEVRRVVDRFAGFDARAIELTVRNKPRALNVGLRMARHEIVLVTDDDCTVDRSWIAAAWTHATADPTAIVTGRVLPVGEPSAVPSTIDDEEAKDYTGVLHYGALYGGNMVCNRSLVVELGGFDERFEAAEDNDFCYRWLRAGRRLRFEPDLVVWHHSWRSPQEMRLLYRRYGRGQGLFYAKHLRRGDLRVGLFLTQDVYRGARGVAARIARGRPDWPDPRIEHLRGVLTGLFGRRRRTGGGQAQDSES
jgi:GT2 family glycosyltransferase